MEVSNEQEENKEVGGKLKGNTQGDQFEVTWKEERARNIEKERK